MQLFEVTHHSGAKKYVNPEHVVTIERQENGDTLITMIAGPALAIKDSMPEVLAALGYDPKSKAKKIDWKEGKA